MFTINKCGMTFKKKPDTETNVACNLPDNKY